jgi:hypothetical protein
MKPYVSHALREHGTDVQEEVKVTDDLRMDLVIYQDNNRNVGRPDSLHTRLEE